MKKKTLLLSISAILFLTSCTPSYEERVDYLETVAQRGVEVHKVIEDQEGGEATKSVCEDAHLALNDDYPNDNFDNSSKQWKNLIKEAFVNACVSGRY